ncbi:MAG: acyl-CoA synthetase FdrA [Anaerolineales bacterium]
MKVHTLVRTSEYHDSVSLMLVARELAKLPGVEDAAVVMATEANKGILKGSGLLTDEASDASPNDLVVTVKTSNPDLDVIAEAEALLDRRVKASETSEFRPKTIRGAINGHPDANVAVISVAGRYAADEAWEALRRGLHVLLFSDNVELDDEIALKQYASDHGLLLMGPGAGTTLLNGVALGFANVVPQGPVGIVSAAGTGLQEVSTLLAKSGVGITQGLGVGGRDLHEPVGGLMMLAGLDALQSDPGTAVIVMISKPPAASVAKRVLEQAAVVDKPTIVCFMGSKPDLANVKNAQAASTLEEAAILAAQAAGGAKRIGYADAQQLESRAAALRSSLAASQRDIRGLFSGGTLCYEAQVILRDLAERPVRSNAPLEERNRLEDSNQSQGHTAVDLGEEEFTVGRPHPMIDNDLRIRRLHQEAADPDTAVIMLDVVIGYGAHPDPASELGPAIRQARTAAAKADRNLLVVGSVTGTEGDPQVLSRQVSELEAAGMVVLGSNAAAARLAGLIAAQ